MSYSVLLTPSYRDIFTQYRNSFSTEINPALLARYRVWPTRVGPMSNSIWVGADPIPTPGGVYSVQATGEANIAANGTLGIAYIINPGLGYFNLPSVTAPPPLPSTVATFPQVAVDPGGFIFELVPFIANGFGYFGPGPYTVTIDPPPGPGVQATATVTVSGGSIQTFTITNPGLGYAPPPAAPPNIVVTPGPLASVQAQLTCTLSGGSISSITLVNQGQNYNPFALVVPLTISAPP